MAAKLHITKFRTMRRVAWIFGLMALVAYSVAAFADDFGPSVGAKAPDIGTRPDQTARPRTFADLMGTNGLVLMFVRSADWCPYCQAQLIEVNGGNAEIEKRGYRVAALSYDSPAILQAFAAKQVEASYMSPASYAQAWLESNGNVKPLFTSEEADGGISERAGGISLERRRVEIMLDQVGPGSMRSSPVADDIRAVEAYTR